MDSPRHAIDLSQSPATPRRQIQRFVKTQDAANHLKERFEAGAARMVLAELKRQRRYARNRAIIERAA